jgi:hypothetical protein
MIPQMEEPPTMKIRERTILGLRLLPMVALRRWWKKGTLWMERC